MSFGDMSTLAAAIASGLPLSPSVPVPGPHRVAPTPTIDRIMSRLLKAASIVGSYPKVLVVAPEDYYDILQEMLTLPTYPPTGLNIDQHPRICGVPVVPIPFLHDPLYKKLQAYAAISGTEITYPGATNDRKGTFDIPMAEAVKDNYGWRFTWCPYTNIGDSTLEEVTHSYMEPAQLAIHQKLSLAQQLQAQVAQAQALSGLSPSRLAQVTQPTPYAAGLVSNSQGAPQCSPLQSPTKPSP